MSSSTIKERIREKIRLRQEEEKAKRQEDTSPYDPLFDNPMFKEMKESMSEEDQQKYKEMGEHMYGNLEEQFNEKGEMTSALETVAQIRVMLQSGMHPSYLTRDEREFLEQYIGKEWYKEFGYLEADVNRINF